MHSPERISGHFIIILVKSVRNWTNPTLKCPKLDKSKPEKTYFALNRCPEKKALAFLLVFGDYSRMETNTTKRRVTLAAKFRLADAISAGLRGQVDRWESMEIAKQMIAAHGLEHAQETVKRGPINFGGYLSY